VKVVQIDGDEWITGSGFPGWSYGGFVLFFLAIIGALANQGVWEFAHRTPDWSDWITIFVSVVNLALLIGTGGILLVILLGIGFCVWLWSTTFLVRADGQCIRARFHRFWGLVRTQRDIPVDTVTDVSARMSSAVGDRQNLDIAVHAGHRSWMVFRCGRSQDAEIVVAYLDRACGRPLRPDISERLDQGWDAIKERIGKMDIPS